ncbi:transcriptional regulator [Streptomyces oceani]|uniref:Transcriptional regulator n=1 Tax=Streptomyces oceani TaxID=1075402 RepID=A0A1E7KFW0_9ACTN|nr:transcriptional regulator [Streptomyces oceani]OEV02822.1 transcriptional regulator [Streptomyces oceani]
MASSPSTSPGPSHGPNTAFRELRGGLSPGEFASAVRRSARAIGERVSCDARYIGRVESGEIRCPNYAYARVFLYMFPNHTLADMGFAPRATVRGRPGPGSGSGPSQGQGQDQGQGQGQGQGQTERTEDGSLTGDTEPAGQAEGPPPVRPLTTRFRCPAAHPHTEPPANHEESDVLRRAFMTGGPAAAFATVTLPESAGAAPVDPAPTRTSPHSGAGRHEAAAVEEAVRRIRLLDDRHGADDLYQHAGDSLRAAYELLDRGASRPTIDRRLHAGAGELAISVGWLAHDSGRFSDARSHYAEALATARVAGDTALEAHAFCNTAFLARDAGRHREAVRAAQAGQHAAASLDSARLRSLLILREAGGWAGMQDRNCCAEALSRAHVWFARGASDTDPAWMSFFGEAELEGLEAQCWAALRDWDRATAHARRAIDLQESQFVRNRALFTAELAGELAARGEPEEAATTARQAQDLLGPVRSARIRGMLDETARRLEAYRGEPGVADFLDRRPPRT